MEVGKLKIVKYSGQKSQVSLTLSDTTMAIDPDEKIPKDHRFDVQAVNRQTLGVFSQNCKKICIRQLTSITYNLNSSR